MSYTEILANEVIEILKDVADKLEDLTEKHEKANH